MGSGLQTLCGQAFGAKRLEMLGIYMQRSWVILIATGIPLTILYIFSTPILKLLHQNPRISKAAGTFALWMIPQLFAYIICFPTQKFLTAQSKIYVLATISAVALVGHVLFSWLFMLKLRWGLPGGAAVLNATWWFITVVQLVYVFSGACGNTWNGFSWKAFGNLKGYLRLSLASGVMLCLEMWYYVALILIAGYTKNAEISVDAASICLNISAWTLMVGIGFCAATSVRVSNELGGGHPRTAKFCVVVATTTSLFIGIILGLIPIALRSQYPPWFSKSSSVQQLVYDLTPLLGITIILNSIQPTLSGVAIGAGWQSYVAYVNIVCYYFVGIPIGLVLGFALRKGVKGIWYGMLTGTVVQTIVLIVMVLRTNWKKSYIINMSCAYSLDADEGDIQQMKNAQEFFREFCSESKKLWYLAAPAICSLVFQHSINAVTQIFAGHVGDIQLAAVAVQISLISGFAFSILYGMGSALQTLCGQAFGAKRPEMLGIYLQRSWVILLATGIPLTTLYIFSTPILNLLHQNPRISKAAGTFALWMIPQLFVYIVSSPTQKFLTAQSKIYVLATISAVALVGHVLFSWLFMLKLRWGLPGGAAALNATWWFVTVVQLVYVFSGACGKTWNGFSWEAFGNLKGYLRLSLASGVMLW
nr:protein DETOXIFICATION 29-like [Ipomoea batatas]